MEALEAQQQNGSSEPIVCEKSPKHAYREYVLPQEGVRLDHIDSSSAHVHVSSSCMRGSRDFSRFCT